MIYWMKSADGGRMPVYDKGESDKLKGMGWTLINFGPEPTMQGDVAPVEIVTIPDEPPPEVQTFEAPVIERKKPGRPRKAE